MESFAWALTAFKAGEVFTAFDIETTGLDNRRDSIVEIGAIRFNEQGIIGRYSQLIDPGVSMPPGAGRVNNITDAMLAGQPSVQEILPAFLNFAEDSVIVAHNAPFDCGFVNQSLSRLYDDGYASCSSLPNQVIDTLPLARHLLPGRAHYNLQELSASLGFKAEAAHRALDDACLCMEIFIHLMGLSENR
ncbi:MAG: 3'-5' exonuclease [Treponema sp.]|nr:3'-5' exonuclease [Treponema sp.]